MILRYFMIVFLAVLLLAPAPAWAYIDAGVAAIALQFLLGAVLGGLMSLKLFWGRIKAFFKKQSPASAEKAEETEP